MRRSLACAALALFLVAPVLLAQGGGQKPLKSDNFDVYADDPAKAKEKAAQLEEAARTFQRVFGVRPPRGAVHLGANALSGGGMSGMGGGGATKPGEAVWTLPWPDDMGNLLKNLPQGTQLPQGMSGTGGMESQMDALTHEAAHLMFLHHVNPGCIAALQQNFNGYGSFLPDWIDEAVAVYHEPESMKATRRQQMKELVDQHIPLSRFFTMNHPIGAHGPGAGGAGGIDPADLQKKLQELSQGGVGGEANLFYVQSLSVFEFMLEAGGPTFVRKLVEHLQKGGTTEAGLALLSRRELKTLEGFESAWVAWEKARR
ncbi:MAG: hypothetical protein HY720_29170 [Planctomycetes bacterium]|nr:hypothetical protein [Planctomycetota bacterium]